jgi:GT2 family glycosyltransferase
VPASIVIVNFNGRRFLGACLEATLAQAHAEGAEIIVVDNASTDGSQALVRAAFPSVRLIQIIRNVGFAEGCNVGVRAATGDPIVILNNDAVPDPGWLHSLLTALEPPDVAVACSVVHDPHFPEAYALGTGTVSVIGHPISRVLADLGQPFYATGCSLAYKRHILGEPFEPIYFAYYEDLLLSWRARLCGFRVARALDSSVQHLGSATASRYPSITSFYYERNKLLTLLVGFETATLWRLAPLYGFDAALRLAEDLSLIARQPGAIHRTLPRVARRYAILARGLTWLFTHRDQVRHIRQRVQAGRRVRDDQITPLLSGKIFEDYVPTKAHSFGNSLSQLYCHWLGIVTAERPGPTGVAPVPSRQRGC